MSIRLGWAIGYAVVGLTLGLPTLRIGKLMQDRTSQYVITAQVAFAVSPLALYPWAPTWWAPASGFAVLALGLGYLTWYLVRRNRPERRLP